jgi:hypothetical protein
MQSLGKQLSGKIFGGNKSVNQLDDADDAVLAGWQLSAD